MAPRTGPERLLGTQAKITSAGLCSALVIAVLLLAGCGGSSDSSEDTTTTGTGAQQSATRTPGEEGSSKGGPSAKRQGQQGGDAAPGQGGGSPSNPGSAGGPSQKHGPRIAQPKGAPEQAPTPEEIAEATVADMTLESPAFAPSAEGPAAIPATYTCNGKKGEWPPLRWSGVPSGTEELILYAMNAAPVGGKLFVDWAVAGLEPSLAEIEAGKLPKGAITGTNSFGTRGYELCPEGGAEVFVFAVYALPEALSPPKGFDARELRKRILDVSGNVGLLAAVGV